MSVEEDDNDNTMTERLEGGDEGVLMEVEHQPPDDLRYNVEGKKKRCINREHAEDSFEASNRNISKFRSKIRNTIAQSKTQTNPIDLSRTAHPQTLALNLRHNLDVHYRTRTNQRKSARQARWRKLYIQHKNRTSF